MKKTMRKTQNEVRKESVKNDEAEESNTVDAVNDDTLFREQIATQASS